MINFHQLLTQFGLNTSKIATTQLKRRINKAQQMTDDGYSLWGELYPDTAIGVIQSQSDTDKYYYTFLRADGTYGCFDNGLDPCLGQPLYLPPQRRRRQRDYYEGDDEEFFEENDEDFQDGYRHNHQINHHQRWRASWEYGMPCKHVISLISGFCIQGDVTVQELLEKWFINSLQGQRRPIRNREYARFIESEFKQDQNSVLKKTVFKPLIENLSSPHSFYRPKKRVKILDSEILDENDTFLEMHVKILGEQIETLHVKNIICISCLRREPDKKKLQSWVKCDICLNHICDTCYSVLNEQTEEQSCPSIFNGFRKHNLTITSTLDQFKDKIDNKYIINNKGKTKRNIIFKFGNE